MWSLGCLQPVLPQSTGSNMALSQQLWQQHGAQPAVLAATWRSVVCSAERKHQGSLMRSGGFTLLAQGLTMPLRFDFTAWFIAPLAFRLFLQ